MRDPESVHPKKVQPAGPKPLVSGDRDGSQSEDEDALDQAVAPTLQEENSMLREELLVARRSLEQITRRAELSRAIADERQARMEQIQAELSSAISERDELRRISGEAAAAREYRESARGLEAEVGQARLQLGLLQKRLERAEVAAQVARGRAESLQAEVEALRAERDDLRGGLEAAKSTVRRVTEALQKATRALQVITWAEPGARLAPTKGEGASRKGRWFWSGARRLSTSTRGSSEGAAEGEVRHE